MPPISSAAARRLSSAFSKIIISANKSCHSSQLPLSIATSRRSAYRASNGAIVAVAAASTLIFLTSIESYKSINEDEEENLGRTFNNMTVTDYPIEKPRATRTFITHSRCNCEEPQRLLSSRYIVDPEPLGEGAFGFVFAAKDKSSDDRFALKVLTKDALNATEFQREADAYLHIQSHGGHPHICALREMFEEGDDYVLVLDLVGGGEMFDHLIVNGAFSEADAARLVRETASALNFLHGIGVVHADMKPENLMLSSTRESDAVVKLVDFGCSEVLQDIDQESDGGEKDVRIINPEIDGDTTPAYCPPEAFDGKGAPVHPSMDMWGLGIIIYIMLTGLHPFDLECNADDEEVGNRIRTIRSPPLRDCPQTAHLSASAIDLLSRLLNPDPKKRMTAQEMLSHPWVKGDTARREIIAGSDERLSKFHRFQTRIEKEVFRHLVSWSNDDGRRDPSSNGMSLMERVFFSFDKDKKGFITVNDVDESGADARSEGDSSAALSLSGFTHLLGENMQSRYFPRGHVLYQEGDIGDSMFFINSGILEVSTSDGFHTKLGQGDSVGEGALLNPDKKRSATIRCLTPVHAIQIGKEYFAKYIESSGSSLAIGLKEKVNTRKFGRAEFIISQQKNLKEMILQQGEIIFEEGDNADALYIVEDGKVDVQAQGRTAYSLKPGDMFGLQSLMFDRTRQATAVCADEKCKIKKMEAKDFQKLMQSSPKLRESIRELCLRREFIRAVVLKRKKSFRAQTAELREAFNAIDLDGSGTLDASEIRSLLKNSSKVFTEEQIQQLMQSLDLDETGKIRFEEFVSVFGRVK